MEDYQEKAERVSIPSLYYEVNMVLIKFASCVRYAFRAKN